MGKPFNFDERLREIDRFFQGTDAVHQTMARVVERLERAGITYAIVGGMAVNAHLHKQTTNDVDVLLTWAGFEEFVRQFVLGDYEPVPKRPRHFRDRTTDVLIDVFLTGLFPRSGKPGPIAYPDPSLVSETIKQKQVVNLLTLIELKLAAGRHKDFGDVVALLRIHALDESFQAKLHPSVHRDYLKCLEAQRREDEYETRHDQALEERMRAEPPPS